MENEEKTETAAAETAKTETPKAKSKPAKTAKKSGKPAKKAAAAAVAAEEIPNVVFVGRRDIKSKKSADFERVKFEQVKKDVPKSLATPRGLIKLPDVEWGKPFYHKDAEYLKSVMPRDFKTPTGKGEK